MNWPFRFVLDLMFQMFGALENQKNLRKSPFHVRQIKIGGLGDRRRLLTEFPATRLSLIERLRSPENGDAWDNFVLIYRPVIYRMARRKGFQDADALDLVQTILIRISSAIGRWEPSAPGIRFRHWLRRVANNAICTAFSNSGKNMATLGDSQIQELIDNQPGKNSDFEREIELEFMREQYLRAAVIVRGEVNEESWRVFELSVIEGQPCDEVASLTGKSLGAVYAVRSRIMRRLSSHVNRITEE